MPTDIGSNAPRVLRICGSLSEDALGSDDVYRLTVRLDALGLTQSVVTSRLPSFPKWQRVGARAQIFRVGVPLHVRGIYVVPAARAATRIASRADLVHAHLCWDPMVLPLAYRVAHRSGLPLVVTARLDLMSVGAARGRYGIGASFHRATCEALLPKADAVVVLAEPLPSLLGGIDERKVHVICPQLGADSLERLIALYQSLVPRLPLRTRGEGAAIEQQPPLARSR